MTQTAHASSLHPVLQSTLDTSEDTAILSLPRLRRTFRHNSEKGVMIKGGGNMTGEIKLQLRKGFSNQTQVFASYKDLRVFCEIEGSPLRGDATIQDVVTLLALNNGRNLKRQSCSFG